MRIAFLYGGFSLGNRPFDFDKLYTDRRGLTGSELSCIEYAKAMQKRGHDVTLIVGQPMQTREWEGLVVRQLDDPKIVSGCDAVLSWNEPGLLREVAPGPVRIVNQQLNDFAYCQPGWEEHVDLVTSPSDRHLEFLKPQAPKVEQWAVLPNGCDPTMYREGCKVPGRVVWASSADRGLHRLLEMWPSIKRRVPHATLRCFYHFGPAHFDEFEQTGENVHPDLLEIAQRKRYIQYAMERLSGPKWGVEHVGSIGRERMRLEWEEAEVLAYPADTIRFTEGFSVTTMEACASGTVPVITDVDALGQIYGSNGPAVVELGPNGFDAEVSSVFSDIVVRALTDYRWRQATVLDARMLAERHAWSLLAEKLETLLEIEIGAKHNSVTKRSQNATERKLTRKERRALKTAEAE